MEENNYRDEFELFLKDNADDFKMVPSRKVWYSVYNNLHPDKKWPSMAVCLLILTAVLYLGIANNNSLSRAAKKASSENFSIDLNKNNIGNNITFSLKQYANQTDKDPLNLNQTEQKSGTEENIKKVASNYIAIEKTADSKAFKSTSNIAEDLTTINIAAKFIGNNKIIQDGTKDFYQKKAAIADDLTEENKIDKAVAGNTVNNEAQSLKVIPAEANIPETLSQNIDFLNVEKSWKEDFAFRNKPAINKFKQNSTFSYYITPSFGYRTFATTGEGIKPAMPASYALASTGNTATELFDNTALNLELGAVLQYNVSKKLRLKTGLQANYTNYVSVVTALGHPTQTSLTLNNNNTNIRSSNYSTKAGNDKINKTTLQISLPLGTDFKLAGNGKLKWYAGATIQPTYVVGGSAFVLSSDEKYYISENALLRKMNLNSSIETFISFKSSNGVVVNVGPQFRYQLLSTYKKEYGYSEKVYNVGIKVGVTTSF